MKFEYLALADAMNFGTDGKVNVLGLGWRQAHLSQIPGPLSFSVVASVTAAPSEAGEYDGEFCLVLPDGSEELLSRGPVVFQEAPEATMLGLVLGLEVSGKPFSQPGLYAIRAKVGSASADYQFRVGAASPAPAPAAAPARRRKQPAAAR